VVMKPSVAASNFRVEQALLLKTPTMKTGICKTINLSFHSVDYKSVFNNTIQPDGQ
jgi:hypothetical protein